MAARVALERRVAGRGEVLHGDRLEVLMRAAEPMEEHQCRPAAGRWSAVGLDQRAGELRPVGHGDRQLLRGDRKRRPAPDERSGNGSK